MNIDPYTFGSSVAAVLLAEKLNELCDTRITKRVSKFVTRYNRMIQALGEITDHQSRISFAALLHKQINEHNVSDGIDNIPDIIVSLSRNVVITSLKSKVTRIPYIHIDDFNFNFNMDELAFDDIGDITHARHNPTQTGLWPL